MAEDDDSKTEDPSGRKLEKAHSEGQFAVSTEVKMAAALISALIVIGPIAPGVASRMKTLLLPFLEHPHTIATDLDSLRVLFLDLGLSVLVIGILPLLFQMALAVAGSMLQTGPVFNLKLIKLNLGKLNPFTGIVRLVGKRSLVELLKSLVKLTIVGTVTTLVVWPRLTILELLTSMDLLAILDLLHSLLVRLLWAALLSVIVLAAADYAWQRYTYTKQMKMSKQETRDEHKEMEGDPQVKGRIRSLRIQRAKQRMMQSVPKATVVVTNPTHFAVALKYEMGEMQAPTLVAKGVDHLAMAIRKVAEENEVPIVENPPLARALYATVELDREIPPEHYKAVAEVIGYVMRLKGKKRR
ncbi:MAG: flagellar biosynthesis protein FlhB [Rhodospirillales bacterium]|nr:flagellar biosynthesis protein FlhB [Rhodospirillales bacterium]